MDEIGCYSFKNFLEISSDEISMVWEWRNNPHIRKWSYNREVNDLESHILYIDSLRDSPDKKYWLVFRKSIPIGVLSIVNINNHKGELGYYIAPEYQGNFYGVGFLYHSLQFLYKKTKIRELDRYMRIDNKAVISLNDKLVRLNKEIIIREINQVKEEYFYIRMPLKQWFEDASTDKRIQELISISNNRE